MRTTAAVLALLCLAPRPSCAGALDEADRAALADAAQARAALARTATGSIQVNVYDGTRRLLAPGTATLVRVTRPFASPRQAVSAVVESPRILIDGLPLSDDGRDVYSVVVSPRGYRDAGVFPVRLSAGAAAIADVMALPKRASFDFSQASWTALRASRPQLWSLLAAGLPERDARARYEALLARRPATGAALFNLTTALSQVTLDGRDWLSYLKKLRWGDLNDYGISAWADARVAQAVSDGLRGGVLTHGGLEQVFHRGSTQSVKQIQFPVANVHFVVFGNVRAVVGGVDCVYVTAHIDGYRGIRHAAEVAKWMMTGKLTDPATVYRLRWTAARQAGAPAFDPPYAVR